MTEGNSNPPSQNHSLQDKRERYTTTEAAKLLGISFITLKRWIYAGKIIAEKDRSGRWFVSRQEIEDKKLQTAVPSENLDQRILDIISARKVAYLREIQVVLEEDYLHKDSYLALRKLTDNGRINTNFDGNRWYFPKDTKWEDVSNIAREKVELMKYYVDHERRFEANNVVYMDYSEYLVETALLRAGYIVVAKDTYYFNRRAYRDINLTAASNDSNQKPNQDTEQPSETGKPAWET